MHYGLKKEDVLEFVVSLEIEVVNFNLHQALESGTLVVQSRQFGLSLGDRACLGLAKKLSLPAVTANKAWQNLNNYTKIILIR